MANEEVELVIGVTERVDRSSDCWWFCGDTMCTDDSTGDLDKPFR